MKALGEGYYIDINKIDSIISLNSLKDPGTRFEKERTCQYDTNGDIVNSIVTERTVSRGKEVDSIKSDTIKALLNIILEEDEPIDETIGMERELEKTSISFQVSFNTLMKMGIIKEI